MLSLVLMVSVATSRSWTVERSLLVEVSAVDGLERAAKLRLGTWSREGKLYKLRLWEDKEEGNAVKALRGFGFRTQPVAPKLPAGFAREKSNQKLQELLDDYRRAWEEHRETWGFQEEKPGEPGEVEAPGMEFLGAMLQYRKQRAFPNDQLDPNAWGLATEHRDQMPTASIGGQGLNDAPSGQWKFIGPTNLDTPYRTYWGLPPVNGRVNAIAVHPTNSNILYIGGAGGGLMKSTDGGVNWTPLGQDWATLQVSCITLDPSDPNKIYVGTGDFQGFGIYNAGIMKSVDAGATWTNLGKAALGRWAVSDILVDPDNPNNIVASTGRGSDYWSYLYRSTNGGVGWSPVISQYSAWSDLAMSPDNGSGVRYYYAVGADYGGQVWRSADRGATWTNIRASLGISNNFQDSLSVACSPVSAERVYVMVPNENRVFKSVDHGGSWSNISGNLPSGYNWSQGWYDFQLTCSRNGANDVLYAGLIDLQVDNNADGSWASVGGPTYNSNAVLHNDQHSMAIDPSNPNVGYVGNDGGFYRTTYNPANGTFSYAYLSGKIGFTQFYSLGTHPTDRNRMLGGTQDNATPWSAGTLNAWDNVGGGDGVGVAVAPNAPNTMAAASQYYGQDGGGNINLYRTTNSWASVAYPSTNMSGERILFVPPMTADANGRIWIGSNYAYRYNTSSWSNKLGGVSLTAGSISAIATAPSLATTAYVGGDQGEVWITTNDGANWRQIDNLGVGIPNRYVTSFSVHRTVSQDLLVGLSGTGGGHVYRCLNPTAITPTWVNVSGSGLTGLPDISVNGLARDPDDPGSTWFAATDVGVFMTTNAGATWSNATAPLGLPNVQCNAISIEPGTRLITVATFGRGMWQIGLPAQFGASGAVLVEGDNFSGGVAELAASDDAYWSFFNDSGSLAAMVEITGVSPIKSVSRVQIDAEVSADRLGLAWTLELFRFSNSTWTSLAGGTGPILDTVVSGFIQPGDANASPWVNQANGQVRARLRFNPVNDEDPAVDGWIHRIDWIRWTTEP